MRPMLVGAAIDSFSTSETPESLLEAQEDAEAESWEAIAARRVLERLPRRHREILVLHILESRSVIEVAEILGIAHPSASLAVENALRCARFYGGLPHLRPDGIRRDVQPLLGDERAQVMASYARTFSYVSAARECGLGGCERHQKRQAATIVRGGVFDLRFAGGRFSDHVLYFRAVMAHGRPSWGHP